jgi:hypothetical protein
LPSGLPWQETEVRFNKHPGGFFYANQFWEANIKSEPTKGSYIYEIYKITLGNEFDFGGRFNTAEDYGNWSLKPVEGAIWRVQPYNGLQGGALIWYPDSMPMYQISFWKNKNYKGYVEFSYQRSIYPKDELGSDSPERQAEAEAFAHSECERLAKLVYKRLPGEESTSESGYDELLNVLAGYGREPKLWEDKKNATKALDMNKGPADERIGYPTNKLLYHMLPGMCLAG